VSVYLDAGILVSTLSLDALTPKTEAALRKLSGVVVVSDFGGAEFSSAIGKRVRTGQISVREARSALNAYDEWVSSRADLVVSTPADVAACDAYLRRLDLPLRTPDGLHIAIASRVGASILSFDKQLLASAKKLGVPVERA